LGVSTLQGRRFLRNFFRHAYAILDVDTFGSFTRISSAPRRAVAGARCAYRRVIVSLEWPRYCWISASGTPRWMSQLANVCRVVWKVTPSSDWASDRRPRRFHSRASLRTAFLKSWLTDLDR